VTDRQRRLLSILACPECGNELRIEQPTFVGGDVVDGDLSCSTCSAGVGVIRTYRAAFLPHDLGDQWSPKELAEKPVDLEVSAEIFGDWIDLPIGKIATSIGSCVTGLSAGRGLTVDLGTHAWSSAALISFGDEERRVELFSVEPGSVRVVLVTPDASARRPVRWSIVVVPGRDEGALQSQAIVRRVCELVDAAEAAPLVHRPANFGNEYPAAFERLLTQFPEDAMVLDVGGGDRCHRDPRVLNFEYLKFDRADFFGDGLRLPIRTGSVDLILSQAVLEHVPEPQRAVDELRRVLRPGGRIWAEFAFMQPLHAVPFHYFNITPHGADLLFDDWDVVATGAFGGLEVTVEWFFRLLDADAKVGADATREVLATLARLDSQLSPKELAQLASGVYVEAIAPAASDDLPDQPAV
jgi:SAM-dependent methyltransferase